MSAVRSHLWGPCDYCGTPSDQEPMHVVEVRDGRLFLQCRTGGWREAADAELEMIKQHILDLLGTASLELASRRKRAEMFGTTEVSRG